MGAQGINCTDAKKQDYCAEWGLIIYARACIFLLMDVQSTIRDAEAAAKSVGLAVADLCADIGVDRATWQRWKSGATVPTLENWMRLQKVLSDLKGRAA